MSKPNQTNPEVLDANNEVDQTNEQAPEHHAVLDSIAGEIDASEAQNNAVDEATTAAAKATAAEEWAQIPAILGGVLKIAIPELGEVYTPEACENWGVAMVPVAEKYGWGSAPVGCEVGLAIATLGLALPTFTAFKKYQNERRAIQYQTQTQQATALATDKSKPTPAENASTDGYPPASFFGAK